MTADSKKTKQKKSAKVSIADASKTRSWIVCESGDRWLIATRRFAVQMMPDHLVASIVAAESSEARSLLMGNPQAIVFWEVTPVNLVAVLQLVAQASTTAPSVLQLAAVGGLSQASQIALSESGVATLVQHPEQLPSLAGMVNRYFGRES